MKVPNWTVYLVLILFLIFCVYSVLVKYKADKGLTDNSYLIQRFTCEMFLKGKWGSGGGIPELPSSPKCFR